VKLRILLLGTVALRAEETHSPLGSPKSALTLAALAWDAGRTVGLDTLVHRVWDEHPPAKARKALYVHIHHIRKALAALAGSHAPAVTSRTHTYELQADPDTVDLRRYLTLLDQGHALADSGSEREALKALKEASRLWAGEPLAGLPGAWAAEIRSIVNEKNLAAALLQADIALRLSRFGEAVAGLQPLAERHSLKQPFAGQFALALHGCGRTEEAARLLQRTLHHLWRSGTKPSDELARIHRGILAGTPVTALLPVPAAPLVHSSTNEPADTLPPDVVWVGRRAELERLTAVSTGANGAVRPTAITGMPGCGKTALAAHAARQLRERFPGGRLVVNLRGHALHQSPMTSAEALRELLRRLGTPVQALPRDLDSLIALWRAAAQDRRFVAVLDDAAGAEQVRPLLPGDSSSLVIITSRNQLAGLRGVQHVALDVLTPADAVALLRRTLGEERTANSAEAATLARLCGYLPLALDITANRLLSRPSWNISDLVQRFNRTRRRLPEIRDPYRAMAQSLEVSYQALSSTQQKAFRCLGLHIGSEFGPDAAAALTGLPLFETERVLEELLAGHLIMEPAPHRYQLHDLLREYAATLAESDPTIDRQHVLERLLQHYLCTADQADRRAYPHRLRIDLPEAPAPSTSTSTWQDDDPQHWFITEGPNLLAALEYTQTHSSQEQLALTAHTLAGFLGSEGYLNTATPLLHEAVAHWRNSGSDQALGRALIDLCTVCGNAGTYGTAVESARTALEMAQDAGDEALEAEALHQLSISYWHTAKHAEAFSFQQRALRLRLAGTDRLQQGRSFNMLGTICLSLERQKDALKYFLEGLARFRDVDDRRGQFTTLNNIAELYKDVGNLDSAINAYQQAIKLSQAHGSKGPYAILQTNLAATLLAHGRPAEALKLYEAALPALRSAGDRRSEAIARNGIGRVLHATRRSEEALAHHTAALAIARTIHAAHEEIQALRTLGEAEAATGRLSQACSHLEASLALSRRIGARSEETETLEALAHVRLGNELSRDS
jgi:tetratricopeptide (TPR) repeat protein/DNA-binding SARP family transcriptional activator